MEYNIVLKNKTKLLLNFNDLDISDINQINDIIFLKYSLL